MQDVSVVEDLKCVYECGLDFMEHGQGRDAASSLEEFIDGMYRVVEQPLEVLIRAEDKLRTCYNDQGTVTFQDTVLKTNPQERRVPG